jgi:RNA polymerase sigma-70 factor (ECF subfamily)
MSQDEWLAHQFETHREHLRAVAYRLLGSLAEADDAVQETWLRVSTADADDVENLGGWLTTITGRICLNMLRARKSRREQPIDVRLPDPVVSPDGPLQPETEALLADSVGLALLVVLDTLTPAERLTFVLHDLFRLPYDEIAPMIGRSSAAARQLASRARRRVQEADLPQSDSDRNRQREVVDAFFRAARGGDFEALLALLDEGVVLRTDFGGKRAAELIRGPKRVAAQSLRGALPNATVHPALVNGTSGAVITIGERPFALMGFVIRDARIVEIVAIADSERVRRLASSMLDDL